MCTRADGFLLRWDRCQTPVAGGAGERRILSHFGRAAGAGAGFSCGRRSAGAAKVAILRYGTWMKRFGGRRDVIGQTVSLSGDPYTIVGRAAARILRFSRGECGVVDAAGRQERMRAAEELPQSVCGGTAERWRDGRAGAGGFEEDCGATGESVSGFESPGQSANVQRADRN